MPVAAKPLSSRLGDDDPGLITLLVDAVLTIAFATAAGVAVGVSSNT